MIFYSQMESLFYFVHMAWSSGNTIKKSPADPSIVWPLLFGVDQMIFHYDVIKRKHFPCYWPLVWGIHQLQTAFPDGPSIEYGRTTFCNVLHGISNHRHIDCLFNSLFRLTTKDISKFWIAGPLRVNPPVTDGFPTQNGQWCGKRYHAMFSKNNQPPTCCHCTTYWWGTFRSISGSPM